MRDEQVVLDPGLGFAKPGATNWPLLARLPELVADGFPVLVGASRKRFLGHLLAGPDGTPAPPLRRDHATAAISALAAAAGAWCVRVHEVAASADAVRVAAAWQGGSRTDRTDTQRPGTGETGTGPTSTGPTRTAGTGSERQEDA